MPDDRFLTALAVDTLLSVRSCWMCPRRSVDWRDQFDRKNPVTMRVRVTVSACSETEVLMNAPTMLVETKSSNATNEAMIALVGEKERPMAWIECLPSTSDTAISETSTRTTA